MKCSEKTNKTGFYYEVTEKQIEEHQKRSIEEILNWIESTNELIWMLQTEEERKRKYIFKPLKKHSEFRR
ncbi:MAG: hypothetical protein A2275_04220 [Bacteroidetes bacterium RIFOXYA12_FULL_35_11]|nr:MAG: hypothetical protein A2X01_10360 [Bacteroidetes bacterium GWF2_35_48]OFY81022.1 MAG: hypothetical protein A2275_04220 [Bacteroidetes bacterium RIFOXYA12_FULL_35_11]OFY94741.1 MAG: hypothetical protein A2491_11265 [Bacteroidetes bacterium RIFOXYC12_FULL_35_7]HBX49949.1 hypothetical protein [Bacteroidales bacterium]